MEGAPLTIREKVELTLNRLRSLSYKRNSLGNLERRIKLLDMKLGGIKAISYDKDIVSGGESHQEDEWIRMIEERQALPLELELNKQEVEMLDKELAALPYNEQLVLERFYVSEERHACERLVEELGYERSQIHRIKDDGLKRLARRLYG